jgi:hypothetical protein
MNKGSYVQNRHISNSLIQFKTIVKRGLPFYLQLQQNSLSEEKSVNYTQATDSIIRVFLSEKTIRKTEYYV